MEVYPEWKKVAWNFGRGFFLTFLAQLVVYLPFLTDPRDFNQWWLVVIVPTIVGTVQAGMKWLRESRDYDSLVYKLPV